MTGPSEVASASPETLRRAARRSRRRVILALLVLFVVAAIVLPLVSLSRYHRTIAESLSRSLGHTVHIGSINLTLLPLPGLVIHDLVVEEDPSFGSEPLLRAPEVTVYPRPSSLWTLRLEISRISLDDASVNLVRDASGRWNFSSLLLQASRAASAPTAQRRPSTRLRFPYIEFSSARINFKNGYEKKPFSFFNTDASVWLADSNHWRIRLKAQPVRTDLDLDLGDTGTVRFEGSLTRAASLQQLPLDLHASWTGAQLGQVSRLLFGFDSGWRGDLRAEADITGDMQDLLIHPRLHVINAHRVEFTPVNEFDLDAFCEGTYHRPQRSLDKLTCLLPTGDGHLLLTGSIPDLTHPQPNLNLEINHTPVSFPVSLLGLLRYTLPSNLSASGTINGDFAWAPPSPPTQNHARVPHVPLLGHGNGNILTGHAVVDHVSIHLANIDQPFTFAELHFDTPNSIPPPTPPRKGKRLPHVSPSSGRESRQSFGNLILLEPASFSAGAPTPMQVSAQLSRSGFSLHFTGESSLARLQPVTRDLAQLAPLQILAPQGAAQSDLTLSGPWFLPITLDTASAQSRLSGWTRLQHARVKPAWLPEPIDILTATAQFGAQPGAASASQPRAQAVSSSGNTITWADASIAVNGIAAKGSASYSTDCENPSGCAAEINLDFPSLDLAYLRSAVLGSSHSNFFQSILSQVEGAPPPWPPLTGTVHVAKLTLGPLHLANARAAFTVQSGQLHLTSLDASTFGGSTHVSGTIQAASNGPKYDLSLTWTGVKLAQAAALFHEKWGTGSVDGQAALNLNGYAALAPTATGTFSWIVNGNWGGAWSPAPPVRSHASWSAAGTFANQTLVLIKGPARGTITFNRRLDLTWQPITPRAATHATSPIAITGTLAHPTISTHVPASHSRQP